MNFYVSVMGSFSARQYARADLPFDGTNYPSFTARGPSNGMSYGCYGAGAPAPLVICTNISLTLTEVEPAPTMGTPSIKATHGTLDVTMQNGGMPAAGPETAHVTF